MGLLLHYILCLIVSTLQGTIGAPTLPKQTTVTLNNASYIPGFLTSGLLVIPFTPAQQVYIDSNVILKTGVITGTPITANCTKPASKLPENNSAAGNGPQNEEETTYQPPGEVKPLNEAGPLDTDSVIEPENTSSNKPSKVGKPTKPAKPESNEQMPSDEEETTVEETIDEPSKSSEADSLPTENEKSGEINPTSNKPEEDKLPESISTNEKPSSEENLPSNSVTSFENNSSIVEKPEPLVNENSQSVGESDATNLSEKSPSSIISGEKPISSDEEETAGDNSSINSPKPLQTDTSVSETTPTAQTESSENKPPELATSSEEQTPTDDKETVGGNSTDEPPETTQTTSSNPENKLSDQTESAENKLGEDEQSKSPEKPSDPGIPSEELISTDDTEAAQGNSVAELTPTEPTPIENSFSENKPTNQFQSAEPPSEQIISTEEKIPDTIEENTTNESPEQTLTESSIPENKPSGGTESAENKIGEDEASKTSGKPSEPVISNGEQTPIDDEETTETSSTSVSPKPTQTDSIDENQPAKTESTENTMSEDKPSSFSVKPPEHTILSGEQSPTESSSLENKPTHETESGENNIGEDKTSSSSEKPTASVNFSDEKSPINDKVQAEAFSSDEYPKPTQTGSTNLENKPTDETEAAENKVGDDKPLSSSQKPSEPVISNGEQTPTDDKETTEATSTVTPPGPTQTGVSDLQNKPTEGTGVSENQIGDDELSNSSVKPSESDIYNGEQTPTDDKETTEATSTNVTPGPTQTGVSVLQNKPTEGTEVSENQIDDDEPSNSSVKPSESDIYDGEQTPTDDKETTEATSTIIPPGPAQTVSFLENKPTEGTGVVENKIGDDEPSNLTEKPSEVSNEEQTPTDDKEKTETTSTNKYPETSQVSSSDLENKPTEESEVAENKTEVGENKLSTDKPGSSDNESMKQDEQTPSNDSTKPLELVSTGNEDSLPQSTDGTADKVQPLTEITKPEESGSFNEEQSDDKQAPGGNPTDEFSNPSQTNASGPENIPSDQTEDVTQDRPLNVPTQPSESSSENEASNQTDYNGVTPGGGISSPTKPVSTVTGSEQTPSDEGEADEKATGEIQPSTDSTKPSESDSSSSEPAKPSESDNNNNNVNTSEPTNDNTENEPTSEYSKLPGNTIAENSPQELTGSSGEPQGEPASSKPSTGISSEFSDGTNHTPSPLQQNGGENSYDNPQSSTSNGNSDDFPVTEGYVNNDYGNNHVPENTDVQKPSESNQVPSTQINPSTENPQASNPDEDCDPNMSQVGDNNGEFGGSSYLKPSNGFGNTPTGSGYNPGNIPPGSKLNNYGNYPASQYGNGYNGAAPSGSGYQPQSQYAGYPYPSYGNSYGYQNPYNTNPNSGNYYPQGAMPYPYYQQNGAIAPSYGYPPMYSPYVQPPYIPPVPHAKVYKPMVVGVPHLVPITNIPPVKKPAVSPLKTSLHKTEKTKSQETPK